jgi:hypothetical protein
LVDGQDGKLAVNLSVTLGVTSSRVGNRAVISLPNPQAASKLYTAAKALEILHALIDVFTPDTAVSTNQTLIAPQKEPNAPLENGGYKLGSLVGLPAGWANYLRDDTSLTFAAPHLPTTAVVEQTGNGSLVHVGDNPAEPALGDVLQLRRAMGYAVPGAAW